MARFKRWGSNNRGGQGVGGQAQQEAASAGNYSGMRLTSWYALTSLLRTWVASCNDNSALFS